MKNNGESYKYTLIILYRRFPLIIWVLFIIPFNLVTGQNVITSDVQKNASYRIGFYNFENLFDTWDDTLKNDEEFQPRGMRAWSNKKFYEKLANMSKAVMALGGWQSLAVLGICEIENDYVLKKLLFDTPLKIHKYRFIHYESGDPRGVDAALIYNPAVFHPLYSRAIPMFRVNDTISRSRDILYVKGTLVQMDTFHFFINHWSSRYGGLLETQEKRNKAAELVRILADSILMANPLANIVIMGDLNDDPTDESLMVHLKAAHPQDTTSGNYLFNLMLPLAEDWSKGSLKHGAHWAVFDQIIVSGALLKGQGNFKIVNGGQIFWQDFLLEPDPGDLGVQPFRTFIGFKYHGGFSDHLPVYMDIIPK